ncbi:MAG TPA: hypothetical protein VGH38_35360 [Bryobacteraceae bacterium]
MSSIRTIALAAALAIAMSAADDRSPASKATAPPVSPGGAVVFIDPATGKIIQPSSAAIGTLAPQPGGPVTKAPVQQIQGSGTAVGARLGPDQLSYAVATVSADGKLSLDCVAGEKAAARKVRPVPSKARKTARAKGGHDEH